MQTEEQLKEEAISQVEENNSPDPFEQATQDARENLRRSKDSHVTSDTILPEISQYGFTDNRAVGPIMRRLVKEGLMIPHPDGIHRPSIRPGSHCAPRRIYIKL